MCYYLFFRGHMELHDKIITSGCESKLADFVIFVSSRSMTPNVLSLMLNDKRNFRPKKKAGSSIVKYKRNNLKFFLSLYLTD